MSAPLTPRPSSTTPRRVRVALAAVALAAATAVGAIGATVVRTGDASDPCDAVRTLVARTLDYRGDAAQRACLGEEDDPRTFAALARGAAERIAAHGPSESRSRGILAEGWSDPLVAPLAR